MSVIEDKKSCRLAIKTREIEMPQKLREKSDSFLCRRFLEEEIVRASETIMLFSGMGAEVDTTLLIEELLRQGKRILLPRCLPDCRMEARLYDPERLKRHRYGMLEPDLSCTIVSKQEIELILVPALSYDRQRMRLGRGGGFYDRYLSDYEGQTIGLCRDSLLCDWLPADPWDHPVQLVLTETERIAE